jgi:NTP pyrophosphatase (non-canonical NTP hydrolase)
MTIRALSTRELQADIVEHKRRMGFNTTSADREICLAMRELGELHEAIDNGDPKAVGAELADVAIYLLTLAEMRHRDLGEEITRKMEVNKARRYKRGPGGSHVRVAGA